MLKTSFDLSSIVWTLIILYSSYATVVRGFTLERLELFYLGVGYLAPILVALMCFYNNIDQFSSISTTTIPTSVGLIITTHRSNSASRWHISLDPYGFSFAYKCIGHIVLIVNWNKSVFKVVNWTSSKKFSCFLLFF